MRRTLFILALLVGLSVKAQVINNPMTANLSASSTNCSVANSCAWQLVTMSAGQSVVTLSGSFTGTFIVEQTNDGSNWTTAATLTSNGTTTYNQNGFTAIRVRCSSYSNGVAVVTISTGTGGSSGGGGGSFASNSSIFSIGSAACTTTNCLQWVDDDTTDNCTAATTSFMNLVNAYAGPGEAHVYIAGSGTGKAYKLASCNLAFTGPAATGGTVGSISVVSNATIDCAQSSGNCIQGGSSSCNTSYYNTGCHDFSWSGGTITYGMFRV